MNRYRLLKVLMFGQLLSGRRRTRASEILHSSSPFNSAAISEKRRKLTCWHMIYRAKGCRKRTEEKWQLHKAGVSPGCLCISVILVERHAFPAWTLLTTWEPVAAEKDPVYVIFTKPWYVRRGQRLWGMNFLVYINERFY